ncbi:MAG: tetratricopeptide repeat protein [Bacteroidia bacterium]
MDRIEQLKEFLKTEPRDEFLNYALAIEYIGLGETDMAKEIFENLIKHSPDYTATYYHLGKMHEKKGEKDLAEEIYRKGILLTQKNKNQHQLAELQSALNNMLYDEE